MMRILVPGLRATIQDRGRTGHAREGIPPSEPADPTAFAAALDLAGCGDADAAIEVVGLPFAFRCDDRRIVAVTGRDARLRTRAGSFEWSSVLVRAGEEVVVEGTARTRYAYVAINGAIDLPPVLSSRATYAPAAIGPWPRPLVAGDAFPLGPSRAGDELAGRGAAPIAYEGPIRAIAGPHDDRFAPETVERFFSSEFTVASESDRMGVRLSGAPIVPHAGELLTCGAIAGAVQVPAGGGPIALLADHQTTGGYPVVATIVSADVGRIAQAAVGERIRFTRVTEEAASRSQ